MGRETRNDKNDLSRSDRSMSSTSASNMAANTVRVALRGDAILNDPHWNKGTGFTQNERKQFALTGRLPYRVNTLDEQCQRAYDQLVSLDTPLRKNSFLQSLKEQNTVLFYQLLLRHLRELMPIIYTPTEVRLPAHVHLE